MDQEAYDRLRGADHREEWDQDHIENTRDIWRWVPYGMLAAGAGLLAMSWAFEARAQGQPGCAPLKMIEDVLKKSYKEERIGFGIVNETTVLLFYASPEGKTFSVLSLNPQGIACPIAGGTDLDLEAVRPGRAI
jgi:hypothetical protein